MKLDNKYELKVLIANLIPTANDEFMIGDIYDDYASLRGLRKRPIDIVVGFESTFEKRACASTLERDIKREGVLLYEKQ